MADHPAAICDRARTWAALAPDGELSELERKLLDAHLTRCPSCAQFALDVAAIAAELRAAAPQPLPRPLSVPIWRRRPVYARVRAVGAAAAVAAMAVGIAERGPLTPSTGGDSFRLPQVTNFANRAPQREVELINRRIANEKAQSRFQPTQPGVVIRPI